MSRRFLHEIVMIEHETHAFAVASPAGDRLRYFAGPSGVVGKIPKNFGQVSVGISHW
jgi:hypothetical protein